jgi:hypothetical protein
MKKLIVGMMFLGLMFGVTQTSFGTLVTPGFTASADVNGNISHTFVYKVSGVSTNVVVMPQGSVDAVNYFNLQSASTTLNANGTFADVKSTTPLFKVRVNWVSRVGITNNVGVTSNILIKYMGSKY